MKFDMSCKVFGIVFAKLLVQYYKKHYPDVDIKKIKKEVGKEYKEMIERTPALAKGNNMAGNLKGAAYFFAMAKKVPGITPEILDDIIAEGFESDFMKMIYKGKKKKDVVFSPKAQEVMYQGSIKSQTSMDEMDWKYTYHKGKDEVSYEITRCGVCRLAEREGLEEFLPCLCKMDYPKYKLSGAKLERSKTLANHDDCCNFHLTRIKEEE